MSTKNIKNEIILSCSPQTAFDAWMDNKKHGTMIGGNAKIDPKVGGKFDIWDGYAVGKTLELDHNKLKIVQSWRDESWPENHYSQITIEFHAHDNNQTKLVFTQTGIPAENVKDIEEGWEDYYWKPMKKYFSFKN